MIIVAACGISTFNNNCNNNNMLIYLYYMYEYEFGSLVGFDDL